MVVRLLRGGPQFTTAEGIRKQAAKGSRARVIWMNGKMIYLKISIESVSGEISIVATHGVYGDGIIKGILEC